MDAERVEQPVPQSVEAVTEPIASWADASEEIVAPEPSLEEAAADTDRAEGHLLEVKQEQIQEASSLGAVLSVIGVPEEVADEVATGTANQDLAPVKADPSEIPAEAAFTDLDRVKEEGQDRLAGEPSSPSEQVDPEVETDHPVLGEGSGPVGTVEAEVEAEGPPAEASEPSESVPDSGVADTFGVVTEATAVDTSDLVPPPTSPNLVGPGTEPIQAGHSPSAPSKAPRTRRCHHTQAGSAKGVVGRFRGISKPEV